MQFAQSLPATPALAEWLRFDYEKVHIRLVCPFPPPPRAEQDDLFRVGSIDDGLHHLGQKGLGYLDHCSVLCQFLDMAGFWNSSVGAVSA